MVKKLCKECGKEFCTYPSKIKLGRGKYCSKRCSNKNTLIKKGQRISKETEFKRGEKPSFYKGFTHSISRPGGRKYKLIYLPNREDCDRRGYVREHRIVAEIKIGRKLAKDEIVHHINGDSLDNSPENLEVMNKKDHDRMNVGLNVHRRWLERRSYPHGNHS